MKIGPQYKICKRLGSSIFEKCQTRRFTVSAQRSEQSKKKKRGGSDYSRQLIEKQKLRLTYGLTEKQFASYVEKALESHENPQAILFELLETRLDAVAYRMGLAGTRRMARQMVSHGHLLVNGVRTTVPSYHVRVGDVVSIRGGSKESGLFGSISEKLKEFNSPSWIQFNLGSLEGTLDTLPVFSQQDTPADIGAVFEYYTR